MTDYKSTGSPILQWLSAAIKRRAKEGKSEMDRMREPVIETLIVGIGRVYMVITVVVKQKHLQEAVGVWPELDQLEIHVRHQREVKATVMQEIKFD